MVSHQVQEDRARCGELELRCESSSFEIGPSGLHVWSFLLLGNDLGLKLEIV